VQLGVVPDAGATYFVTRILGEARATEWFLRGTVLSADEALGRGLLSEVVPDHEVLGRAVAVAEELSGLAEHTVAATRSLTASAARAGLGQQLEVETTAQLAVTRGRTGGPFLDDERFART
jgi:2-(1,2-epoxy-1,2-dihydrophenyl)acetyl-CoA isomerase